MIFGDRLKELIEEKELKQRDLALALNISPTTLNGYVNSYREPDFETLCRIASYFEVSTDYLLGVSGVLRPAFLSTDQNAQRLFHYYQLLTPDLKQLLLDQAVLLTRYGAKRQRPGFGGGSPERIVAEASK